MDDRRDVRDVDDRHAQAPRPPDHPVVPARPAHGEVEDLAERPPPKDEEVDCLPPATGALLARQLLEALRRARGPLAARPALEPLRLGGVDCKVAADLQIEGFPDNEEAVARRRDPAD